MAALLSCLSWIPTLCEDLVHVFIPKINPIPIQSLPDDIIADVLSRLPAEQVVECQTVCKRWMNLTRTRYFIDSHSNRAKPRIMVQYIRYSDDYRIKLINELRLFEDWSQVRLVKKHIFDSKYTKKLLSFGNSSSISSRYGPYRFGYSYNGLLVLMPHQIDQGFSSTRYYLIYNPITEEKIKISVSVRNERLCGIFLHPKTKDHMALVWYGTFESPSYKIRSLSSGSPWKQLGEGDGCSPPDRIPPVVINESMHWLSNSDCSSFIKVYDILTEKITARPHPKDSSFPCNGNDHDHNRMRLLEIQGHLAMSAVHADENGTVMDVWVLEDYMNWEWVKKYVIELEISGGFGGDEVEMAIPLGVLEGEMVIHWIHRGLFGYELEKGKLQRYHRWPKRLPLQETLYLSLYTGSLVPLTNQSEEPPN